MNEAVTDRLYQLLPSIYRVRDAEHGQVLRALFRVLENEYAALEQDVEELYDNWFIETCAEWLVPYIGDLLKAPGLNAGGVGSFSLRAYVANLLAYRRRKGTAAVLEQMAGDVSGWRARVVEFGRHLAATQSLNHIQRAQPAYVSVRNADALALLDGPFDTASHTAEVRHADSSGGRYNIPDIGIFLWRLQSYEVERGAAGTLGDGIRYTFNPLGLDVPLFNNPQPETEITHLAEEVNVPAALRRRPLYRELEARRAAIDAGATPRTTYFGSQPPFQIYLDGASLPLAPEAIAICDLNGWEHWTAPPQAGDGIAVLVDPECGRLALPAGSSASRVEVSYAYGFSGDVGGGPYNRSDSLTAILGEVATIWWRGVSASAGVAGGPVYATLSDAVTAWNDWNSVNSGKLGVIAVLDSATYEESLTGQAKVELDSGNRLIIVGARWRSGAVPAAADPEIDLDHLDVPDADLTRLLVAEGVRPCLLGNVSVKATASSSVGSAGLHLNGLLIGGQVTVLVGDLGRLEIAHCTVVPADGGITVRVSPGTQNDNAHLDITLTRSVSGPLVVPDTVRTVQVADSIVDVGSADGYAISGKADGSEHAAQTSIVRSTVRGLVRVKTLELASETLFTQAVRATRLQAGCTRYSYLPDGSQVPHRFRCQPDLALLQRAREISTQPSLASEADLSAQEVDRIVARMSPMFTSLDYGDPGYMQLATACAEELRTGAEDGAEMGVFSHLRQPQREANIRVSLSEYLRFGLEAGIFYVN